jgi:Tol biopolymer transport system component
MNSDGTGQFDVLGKILNVAVYPSWTHDGKQIVFGAPDASGQIQITQVNPDGTGLNVISEGPQPHSYAAWSPDGRYLAYVSDPGSETADLCIYDAGAKQHRVVVKGDVFEELFRDARPAWVPAPATSK